MGFRERGASEFCMRYSVVMPYYKRPELRFTLDSYTEYYSYRDDLEVIIVEDSKNYQSEEMHKELTELVKRYTSKIPIVVVRDPKVSYCPSSKYNLGVRVASGSIIMLTNPETPHNFDFFKKLDKIDFTNKYVVCACASVKVTVDRGTFFNSDLEFVQWYQHSEHRNAQYHFCSVISKENYNRIGGFDERFSAGIAFDDDNFLMRVKKSNLDVVVRDDIYAYHIEHPRDYSITPDKWDSLRQINLDIWRKQLETEDF